MESGGRGVIHGGRILVSQDPAPCALHLAPCALRPAPCAPKREQNLGVIHGSKLVVSQDPTPYSLFPTPFPPSVIRQIHHHLGGVDRFLHGFIGPSGLALEPENDRGGVAI